MTRSFGDTRNGIGIRSIEVSTGDHVRGEIGVVVTWWRGEFEQDHKHDQYGAHFYNGVTPASALRAFRALMYLASLRLETMP
jgi:hypothetical protein